MLPLRKLQTLFREVIVGDDAAALESLLPFVEPGKLPPRERMSIYANNVTASLTEVLKETFPSVCRLVDERFFSYAAKAFISTRPPMRPCLTEYGGAFAGFLAEFPPCAELRYLADVARLEWLMNVAAHAQDFAPADSEVLAAIVPEEAPQLLFRLDPSLGYLASDFPVDDIWRANRSGGSGDGPQDLASGSAFLEIRRLGNDVVFRRVGRDRFEFRNTLVCGGSLSHAIAMALAANPGFDAAAELGALFAEQGVAAISLDPKLEETQ